MGNVAGMEGKRCAPRTCDVELRYPRDFSDHISFEYSRGCTIHDHRHGDGRREARLDN